MLSKALIEELQQIMKKNYGVDMSYAEADNFGTRLVGYFGLLAKVDHRTKLEEKKKDEVDKASKEDKMYFFADQLARLFIEQARYKLRKKKQGK